MPSELTSNSVLIRTRGCCRNVYFLDPLTEAHLQPGTRSTIEQFVNDLNQIPMRNAVCCLNVVFWLLIVGNLIAMIVLCIVRPPHFWIVFITLGTLLLLWIVCILVVSVTVRNKRKELIHSHSINFSRNYTVYKGAEIGNFNGGSSVAYALVPKETEFGGFRTNVTDSYNMTEEAHQMFGKETQKERAVGKGFEDTNEKEYKQTTNSNKLSTEMLRVQSDNRPVLNDNSPEQVFQYAQPRYNSMTAEIGPVSVHPMTLPVHKKEDLCHYHEVPNPNPEGKLIEERFWVKETLTGEAPKSLPFVQLDNVCHFPVPIERIQTSKIDMAQAPEQPESLR